MPLRAGVARCGGDGRASPGGGAFHHGEGRLRSGAVPPPTARPLERAARVPRPVCPGCGRCGRGDPAAAPQRAPLRCSLWGWREGVPGGGCLPPLRRASEARRRPSPDCPPAGRAVGVRHPRAVGAGVWVWGPNTVRPPGLHVLRGLHAAGVVGGRPRGVGRPPLRGAPGVRRCPSLGRPSSGAGS